MESSMPLFLIQFTYSAEAWKALVRNPEDRTPFVESLAKSVGARVVSHYYHLGEYDGTLIVEAPDDATANAVVFAAVANGAVGSTRTTRVVSPKELLEALGKAGKAHYSPPGKTWSAATSRRTGVDPSG
jgi:uncharacterized protein with GYD domain